MVDMRIGTLYPLPANMLTPVKVPRLPVQWCATPSDPHALWELCLLSLKFPPTGSVRKLLPKRPLLISMNITL